MSLTWQEQQQAIEEAVKRFPDEFGLRSFPGEKFKIASGACYFDGDQIMLYTYRWCGGTQEWRAFAKGTEKELRSNIVALQ